jgi:serine/threonine-protein kinase
MAELKEKLHSWLQTSDDFLETNPLQWKEELARIFPVSAPTRAIWTDPASIVTILNSVGQANLNHLFFPDSGGMDLEGARLSVHEPGCIELHTSFWNIVKPLSLTLETFSGDAQWNYLRLETGRLEPAKVPGEESDRDDDRGDDDGNQDDPNVPTHEYTSGERASEELTEIDERTYASRACWDEGRYNDKELPENARVVIRWFGGAFVIFQKTSFYNLAHGKLDAYDGRHSTMNDEQFRAYIEVLRSGVQERGIDLRARRIEERGVARRVKG